MQLRPMRRQPAVPATANLPGWLFLPGVILLAVAFAVYVQTLHAYPPQGLDLLVYRGGAAAWLAGRPVYDQGFGQLNLPFTYPPITLPLFALLSTVAYAKAWIVLTAAGLVALAVSVWLTFGLLGYRPSLGRVGASAAVTAAAMWLEPAVHNFDLGQINAFLLLLIVADLSLADRNRLKGMGVGIATAVKLTPAIFIVYLVLTRRFRAAAMAIGTFMALTGVGWIASPEGSRAYWLGGLFARSSRVAVAVGPGFVTNQSLHGTTARLFGGVDGGDVWWYPVAAVVAVAGMAFAARLYRRGEDVMGVLAAAFTGLLVSPISWSHHWMWVAPLLVLLIDVARRSTGRLRVAAAGLAPLAIVAFLAWPLRLGGGPLRPYGAIWWSYRPGRTHRTLAELVIAELYPIATVLIFTALLYWLRVQARRHRSSAPDPADPATVDSRNLPAVQRVDPSEISAVARTGSMPR